MAGRTAVLHEEFAAATGAAGDSVSSVAAWRAQDWPRRWSSGPVAQRIFHDLEREELGLREAVWVVARARENEGAAGSVSERVVSEREGCAGLFPWTSLTHLSGDWTKYSRQNRQLPGLALTRSR